MRLSFPSHPTSKGALFFLLLSLLCFPFQSFAGIREVTLFPASAKILETVTLSHKNTAVVILPPQADPASLIVSPPGGSARVDDISIKPADRADENKIAKLRAQIKKLQNDKKELHAKAFAMDTQIQFWQAQTKAKAKTVTDADHLSSAIGRNIHKLSLEKSNIESDYPTLDKKLKDLEDELTQASGKKEKAWEATILLSGTGKNGITLTYSYMVNGCGWTPLYRLEADVASQSVLFSWEADVWQSTGEDWKAASIHLATLQPPQTLAPPDLPGWVIKPKKSLLHKSSRNKTDAPVAELNADAMAGTIAESVPVETAHATYSVWSIGQKTIDAGRRQRIKIREDRWPADFRFVSRPSLSPQAFLQAHVKMPHTVDVPPGEAFFVIDGATIGKHDFTLAGSETDIFFGNSPFITVASTVIEDQTGSEKFIQNKQTRQWHWRVEAHNTGRAAVALRIEEPIPQARDKRIKLKFKHQPEPAQMDAAKWIWNIDVPALQKKSIETMIELEAPGDMVLDFGLRH